MEKCSHLSFTIQTKDNLSFAYALRESSDPPVWEIGETTTIIYDPSDPSKVSLYRYFRVFIWTLVLLSIALLLIVIGGGFFIVQDSYFSKSLDNVKLLRNVNEFRFF